MPMLFAFAFSFILAYFLNRSTTKLAALIGSRGIASLLVVTFLSILVILVLSLAIPLLYHQLILFLKGAPQLIAYIENSIKTSSPGLHSFLEERGMSSLFEYLLSLVPQLSTKITQHLWNSTLVLANIVILLIFTPVILFYLLQDWPKMTNAIKEIIPLKHRTTFNNQVTLMDASISGYVLGQMKISFILGVLYTVLLFFAGMPYYFLIGVSTGMLTIIPYFGNITGLITSHLVALSRASSILDVLPITLIFIFCGAIEGMFLSPKLLSKSVNLHPLWVIFSMTVGGMLFGLAGILLAVPVAATVAGFVRLGISYYKDSSYYKDEATNTD
ncbi:AI-2E family transporter [Neorickettsia risticii]